MSSSAVMAYGRSAARKNASGVEFAGEIRRFVDEPPTPDRLYGYRRIAALLKRERRSADLAPVNGKRVYRLMKCSLIDS